MLSFRPNLPLVLSYLCTLLSQVEAQSTLPDCAVRCSNDAISQTGCDMSVSSPLLLPFKADIPSLQH